jgi:hypothetical protein
LTRWPDLDSGRQQTIPMGREGTGGFIHDEPRYEPDDGPLTQQQVDQLKQSVKATKQNLPMILYLATSVVLPWSMHRALVCSALTENVMS